MVLKMSTKTKLISVNSVNPKQVEAIINSKLDQVSPKVHTHIPSKSA